jgi:hypothetical protein
MTRSILQAPVAFAQGWLSNFSSAADAFAAFSDSIDDDGRWQGYPGTRSWALDVLQVLLALKDFGKVPTNYDVQKLKSEGKYTEAGRAAYLANLLSTYGCHYGLRSELRAAIDAFSQGYWEAKDEVENHKARAEAPKAPEALTVDELAAELTQELPGDLIDAEGGVWHVKVTDVSHIRPERALWVERALGNHTGVEPAIYGFYAPSLRFAKAKLGVKPVDPQGHEVDLADLELRVLAGWADFAPKCPITPLRAQELVITGGKLTADEREALVAYIGLDDDQLISAWIDALDELQSQVDLRKLDKGLRLWHAAAEKGRAARRGWDAQDVAWRSQALKGLQDSRNAAQVAA